MGAHLAVLLLLAAGDAAAESPRGGDAAPAEYVFAIVPQAPPVVMSLQWAPILERVSREARVTLRVKLYEKVEAFQADLAAGAVDLAYLNPIQAIRAFRAARYRPLLRDEEPIRGVFFVRRDSAAASFGALAGQEVALAGPWSFCSVTLRHETQALGIVPRYVGTTANVYKHVLLGLTPFGGSLDNVLADAPPDVRDQLRVIYATPAMAPHAVVVHPRLPAETALRILEAFRALAGSAEGQALLGPVHLRRPVPAEYARDYGPLEHVLDDAPARAAGRR